MKKTIITSTAIFSLVFINSASASLCTNDYNPVCGKDQKTYSNMCTLGESETSFDYSGECHKINEQEQKNIAENLIKKQREEKASKINKILDGYFSRDEYKNNAEKQISFIDDTIWLLNNIIDENKQDDKGFIIETLIAYGEKIIEQAEKDEIIKKENEKVVVAPEAKVADFIPTEDVVYVKKYFTNKDSENIRKLRTSYLRDNLGVRSLGGSRITAYNIIGKEVGEDGITKNYTVIVSEEYYKDDAGELHKGISTIKSVVVDTIETETSYEIIGYTAPRDGEFYGEDIKKMFPAAYLKELDKRESNFMDTVKTLQKINLKNARRYFANKN